MSTEHKPALRSIKFDHQIIDDAPPCTRLGFCLTSDLTGNGLDDVIVGGMGTTYPGKRFVIKAKRSNLPTFDGVRDRFNLNESNLFWYENPGWKRHRMAFAPRLDVGAALGDLTGNGRKDIVAGQTIHNHNVYWFEQPEDPTAVWPKRVLTDVFEKYHDLEVADVDDDGEPEVIGLSQESQAIFFYDIPDDPTIEPWPDTHRNIVAKNVEVEGLEVVDIDGDGRTEIIAGPNVFHRSNDGDTWNREPIATGWDYTRVQTADIDDDGELEVVLSEGDSPKYGTHPGRVAWFSQPDWEPTFLFEDLYCPHSVQIADFDGNGLPDIFIGEMGLGENENPTLYLARNLGDGAFENEAIARGVETHEAKAVDMTDDGRPDIVGKSYTPNHHVDIWYNRS